MTEQIDLLAALDAAIERLRAPKPAETLATSRSSRSSREKQDTLVDNSELRPTARESTMEGRADESIKITGSTGTTGSIEDSCGFDRARDGSMATSVTGTTGSIEDSCGFQPLLEPVLLADGRRMYRFNADRLPASVSYSTRELCDQVRAYGVVLVADGPDLIVVECWLSDLPPKLLQQLRAAAGGVIAVLRGEARARLDRQPAF